MASLLHTYLPAQRLQMTTQRLMEAQSGWAAPQSAQNLLGAAAQMRSATSEVDRASAMAPCMASSHCSFSNSESAEKLGTHKQGNWWERAWRDLRVRRRCHLRTAEKLQTKEVWKLERKGELENANRKDRLKQVMKRGRSLGQRGQNDTQAEDRRADWPRRP